MVVTTGDFPPPNPPSPVRATMVLTASTSNSGPILSMAVAMTPFTLSATGPPFSYGMPSSGTSPVLSYSTSQTLGLGAGSSNAPLQGHMGGTSAPFNAFPYGGGHIPPSSPSLGGTHQQSTGPPTHHSLFGAGSQGPPAHNMSIGSTPFSLFGAFGNNAFSSASFLTGGNPGYRQPIPMQGTIPAQGANPGTSSTSGPWNSWQGSVPSIQTLGPFCHGCNQQPKLPFLETLHLLDLKRLLNDPICHNPHWPPMSDEVSFRHTKFQGQA
jgi:hypothetical protein